MPTIDANSNVTETRTCPLCDTPIDPAHPNECPRCDWVIGYRRQQSQLGGTKRDRISVALSFLPGLGHIYKGYRVTGAAFMIGALAATVACFLAATASAGWGLLLLPFYWLGTMLHVFWLEDRFEQPPLTMNSRKGPPISEEAVGLRG